MRKFNFIKYIVSVLMLIVLVTAAFAMPGVVYSIYDDKIFGKKENMEIEVASYEKEHSFEAQLTSIAKYFDGTCDLSAVRMEEGNSSVSNNELADIINKELDRFIASSSGEENVSFDEQSIMERNLYTVYVTVPEDEEARNSITMWLLRLNINSEMYDYAEILLDMEYHKIYNVRFYIKNDDLTEKYEKYEGFAIEESSVLDNYYAEYQFYCIFWQLQDNKEIVNDASVGQSSLDDYYLTEYSEEKILPVNIDFLKDNEGCYIDIGIKNIRSILQL